MLLAQIFIMFTFQILLHIHVYYIISFILPIPSMRSEEIRIVRSRAFTSGVVTWRISYEHVIRVVQYESGQGCILYHVDGICAPATSTSTPTLPLEHF